jgi:hypothetical protein
LGVGSPVGSLAKIGGKRGIDIGDYDALAEVVAGGFVKDGGLGVRGVGCTDDVEASDAAVEPEAGDVGHVGDGDLRVKVEQDANVVAAGFVDEVVEIVQGAVCGVDGLGVRGAGLDGSEEERVDTKGTEVIETLSHSVEAAAAGGAKVGRIDVVDDGVLPPEVGAHSRADPAGTSESLCRCGRIKGEGE